MGVDDQTESQVCIVKMEKSYWGRQKVETGWCRGGGVSGVGVG